MSSPVLRRLASWIAVLAVVAVTFMPTLTRLWSTVPLGMEICSADAGRKTDPAGTHHALDHCPYCALHADFALPVPPAVDAVPVALLPLALPRAFLAAPRATSTWTTAQSRAPPAAAQA